MYHLFDSLSSLCRASPMQNEGCWEAATAPLSVFLWVSMPGLPGWVGVWCHRHSSHNGYILLFQLPCFNAGNFHNHNCVTSEMLVKLSVLCTLALYCEGQGGELSPGPLLLGLGRSEGWSRYSLATLLEDLYFSSLSRGKGCRNQGVPLKYCFLPTPPIFQMFGNPLMCLPCALALSNPFTKPSSQGRFIN